MSRSPSQPATYGTPSASRSGSRAPRRPIALVALALAIGLPGVLGASGGCKCKKVGPDDPAVDDAADAQQIRLERKLQVSRIVPDTIAPGVAFSADVLGAGLKPGARLKVGLVDGTEVQVHSESRLSVTLPGLEIGEYDVTVTNPDGESVTLRRGLTVRVQPTGLGAEDCRRATVYFDFDRDTVTTQARATLDPLVPCLQQVRGRIRLEGHTDERGTTDYNLALGQRRADAVHRYLVGQTVPIARLRTVSFGEERPADPASNERAWAKNRRVELVVED